MRHLHAIVALLAAQCTTPAPPPPAPVPPAPVATPTPDPNAPPPPSSPDCAGACAHLDALGCADAKPTAGGASCAEVCANVNASGTIRYPIDCVRAALSCDAAEACFR